MAPVRIALSGSQAPGARYEKDRRSSWTFSEVHCILSWLFSVSILRSVIKSVWLMLLLYVSQCSAECGAGSQQRSVVCLMKSDEGFTVMPPYECSSLERPLSQQSCNLKACGAKWYHTEWSAVSEMWNCVSSDYFEALRQDMYSLRPTTINRGFVSNKTSSTSSSTALLVAE